MGVSKRLMMEQMELDEELEDALEEGDPAKIEEVEKRAAVTKEAARQWNEFLSGKADYDARKQGGQLREFINRHYGPDVGSDRPAVLRSQVQEVCDRFLENYQDPAYALWDEGECCLQIYDTREALEELGGVSDEIMDDAVEAIEEDADGRTDWVERRPHEEEPPVTIILRSPYPGEAELVIGDENGACQVYSLSFDQLRLLAAQASDIVSKWPAGEEG